MIYKKKSRQREDLKFLRASKGKLCLAIKLIGERKPENAEKLKKLNKAYIFLLKAERLIIDALKE